MAVTCRNGTLSRREHSEQHHQHLGLISEVGGLPRPFGPAESDARPASKRYNNAGMDVSPALSACLGFSSLNGDTDRVSWRFADAVDVPHGPWRKIITRTHW